MVIKGKEGIAAAVCFGFSLFCVIMINPIENIAKGRLTCLPIYKQIL